MLLMLRVGDGVGFAYSLSEKVGNAPDRHVCRSVRAFALFMFKITCYTHGERAVGKLTISFLLGLFERQKQKAQSQNDGWDKGDYCEYI